MELGGIEVVEESEKLESVLDGGERAFGGESRHGGIGKHEARHRITGVDLVGDLSLREITIIQAVVREAIEDGGDVMSVTGR